MTLWGLLRGHRRRYGGAIGATLLSSFFLFVPPVLFGWTIDFVLQGKPLDAPWFVRQGVLALGGRDVLRANLWIPAGLIAAASLAAALFAYAKGRWAARATEEITRATRNEMYDHLQHLPVRYFRGAETGDLVQRCTSDIETIRVFLSHDIVHLVQAIVVFLVGVAVLGSMDWLLTAVAICLVPLLVVFSYIFFTKVGKTFREMDESEARMTSRLQENITGARVVRAFARQEHEIEKFREANFAYRGKWYRLIAVMGWFWPVSDVISLTQVGLMVFVGAHFVVQGRLEIGTFIAFNGVVWKFLWPVRQVGRHLANWGKAEVSLRRLREVLREQRETDPPAETRVAPSDCPRGHMLVRDVWFSHDGQTPVLEDVSFEIHPGQTLAILGPSGSGKSTLISLLLRLYDYDRGTITLDGVELRAMPRKDVRRRIASVLQEPFLFSKSVRDNIALGAHEAGVEEVQTAASMACVHESIAGFEHGYDTVVGERGVTLSGGQRQRVAIARALLRNPPILILDDALSAVDTKTEATILDTLRHRHGQMTTIVIAHRLTTLMRADQILVFEDGRVVQAGTHEQLLAQDGRYRRLWGIQSLLEDDLRDDLDASPAETGGLA
jgi:ATP-binding cassette subfamily B protein